MQTFKEYLIEHCKTGKYFMPFNKLQLEILRELYNTYLVGKIEGFDKNSYGNTELFMLYYDKLPMALKILGDILCKYIPNEKTLIHTGYDVKRWAKKLFELLRKNENI